MRRAFAREVFGARGAAVALTFGVATAWAVPAMSEDASNITGAADAPALERLPDAEAQLQEIADLNIKMRSLETAAEERLAATTARGAGVAKLAQSIDQMLALLDELRGSNDKLRASTSAANDELGRARAETTHYRERSEKLVLEQDELNALLARAQESLAQSEARLASVANELVDKSANSETLRADLDRAKNEVAARDARIREMKETLIQAEKAIVTQSENFNLAETKIAALDKQLSALQERLATLQAERVEELEGYRSEFFGRLSEVLGARGDIRVAGDRFVFQSDVLFDAGSARLDPAAANEIEGLARTLREIAAEIPPDLPWILRIDGHTDARPISNDEFASNWELSVARAISVVNLLVSRGIEPGRLAAAGFGEFQPIDPRADEIGYRRNRRIELRLSAR